MCQLLGVASNRDVDIAFSFMEWRHRGGPPNPDGYGFAFWPQGQLEIVKKARDLLGTPAVATAKVQTAKSRIFVCHVRFASVGSQDGSNTHPFGADWNGTSFVFAHNGTLKSVFELAVSQTPKGGTDSEHAFHWILDQLSGVGHEEFPQVLKESADHVRALGRFNFLLSDGATLWAYADDALHYIERRPPYGDRLVTLEEDGYSIELAEVKAPEEQAVLVATEPLSDEPDWNALRPGELLVIRDGSVQSRLV